LRWRIVVGFCSLWFVFNLDIAKRWCEVGLSVGWMQKVVYSVWFKEYGEIVE